MEKKAVHRVLMHSILFSGRNLSYLGRQLVLMGYAQAAVMAVPGPWSHEIGEFATKYQLPIKQVIAATAMKWKFENVALAAYTERAL